MSERDDPPQGDPTGGETLDWIALSGRKAKGRRPDYFDDPALDRLYSVVFALAAEVSALRERQDTLERLLERSGTLDRAEIDTFAPDRAAGEERALATRAYVARIMRGFQQAMEAMEADEPPIMHWVDKFAED